MTVPKMDKEDPFEIYCGDALTIPLEFMTGENPTDLSIYDGFKSHWRVREDAREYIELVVNTNEANVGKLFLSSNESAKMLGPGVIDIQVDGPLTLVKLYTIGTWDVTR